MNCILIYCIPCTVLLVILDGEKERLRKGWRKGRNTLLYRMYRKDDLLPLMYLLPFSRLLQIFFCEGLSSLTSVPKTWCRPTPWMRLGIMLPAPYLLLSWLFKAQASDSLRLFPGRSSWFGNSGVIFLFFFFIKNALEYGCSDAMLMFMDVVKSVIEVWRE